MAQSYNCIAIAQKGQSSNCQVCLMKNQTMFVPIELFSHHIYYANELWACFPLSEHKYKVCIFSSPKSTQFARIKDLLRQGVTAVLQQYPCHQFQINTVRVMPERNRFQVTDSASVKAAAKCPLSHSEVIQLAEHGLEQGKHK